jgi:plastocyanin
VRASFLRGTATLAVAALALVACGGSDSGSADYKQPAGPAVKTLAVKSGNLYFDPKRLDAPAGVIAIKLTNVESGAHDLRIRDVPGFDLSVSGDGDSTQKKVELKPGTYEYYCSIPGHDQMKGELTIR